MPKAAGSRLNRSEDGGVLRQIDCSTALFHTAPIVLGTSFMPAGHRVPVFTANVAPSNYAVFKGPATLYKLRMMPDSSAFVLTSSNERGGVPSAKMRLPVPNRTG